MEPHEIEKLVAKFYKGLTSSEEEEMLRKHFEGEEDQSFETLYHKATSRLMKGSIELEKLNIELNQVMTDDPNRRIRTMLYAAASLLVIMVALILFQDSKKASDITLLSISDIKEMSSMEKLKYLNANSEKIDSKYFQEVLIPVLESESSPNVKLVILDLSRKYMQNSDVRGGVFQTIEKEDSYIVQMTLFDLMKHFEEDAIRENIASIMNNKNLNPELVSLLE